MTVDEIKEQRPIIQELEAHGVHVDRAGFCQCIFHREKTASMKVYPETKSFYCFGCGKSGDIFDIVQQLNGVNFSDAFKICGGSYERPTVGMRLRQSLRKSNRNDFQHRKKRMYDRAIKAADRLLDARRELGKCEEYSAEWAKAYAHYQYTEYIAETTFNEWADLE